MEQKYLKYKNKYLQLKYLFQIGGDIKVGDIVYINDKNAIGKIASKISSTEYNVSINGNDPLSYNFESLLIPKFQIGTTVILNGEGSTIKNVIFSNQKGYVLNIDYGSGIKRFIYNIKLIGGAHSEQELSEVNEDFLKLFNDSPEKGETITKRNLCKRK
jgi:hypothetical protein